MEKSIKIFHQLLYLLQIIVSSTYFLFNIYSMMYLGKCWELKVFTEEVQSCSITHKPILSDSKDLNYTFMSQFFLT